MNRNASTEAFKAIAEKHMNPQMDLGGNHKLGLVLPRVGLRNHDPRYKFEPEVTPAPDKGNGCSKPP